MLGYTECKTVCRRAREYGWSTKARATIARFAWKLRDEVYVPILLISLAVRFNIRSRARCCVSYNTKVSKREAASSDSLNPEHMLDLRLQHSALVSTLNDKYLSETEWTLNVFITI